MKAFDLVEILSSFEEILRRTIREDIVITFKYANVPCVIKADRGQVEQIVLNLVVNAQDAMPQGGKIEIEVMPISFLTEETLPYPAMRLGNYVLLSIRDTGIGMTADLKDHIFEPFFTTKEKSRGVGLGLATVYGIVKQHGGYIWVESEPSKGSHFRVYLRASPATDSVVSLENEQYISIDPGGNETVMIMEDDEMVRELTCQMLTNKGYSIVAPKDPETAIKIIKENKVAIDLLLTDVVMPGMNGKDVYEAMCNYRPNLKVIYMSGYSGSVITDKGILEDGVNFIQKPFTIRAVCEKVRSVLHPSK